jgi:hypothetical protein
MLRRPIGRGGRPGLIGMAARTAVVAGTATAVAGGVSRRQEAKADAHQQEAMAQQAAFDSQEQIQQMQAQMAQMQAQQAAAAMAPAAAPATASPDMMAQLQQLTQMKQAGVLTDEEFAAAKAKLLGA